MMQHPFVYLGLLCMGPTMSSAFAPILPRSPSHIGSKTGMAVASSPEIPVDLAASSSSSSSNGMITAETFASRRFQLEEMEGSNSCITDIVLAEDFTLQIGDTDGPPPAETVGYWMLRDDGSFAMNICRKFNTGYKGSDMGEFSFVVERDYAGCATNVGGLLALEGSLHIPGDNLIGDAKVGYFSMIDVTEMTDDRKRSMRNHFTAACLM